MVRPPNAHHAKAIIEVLALDGNPYRTPARVAGDEQLTSTVLPTLNSPASIVFG